MRQTLRSVLANSSDPPRLVGRWSLLLIFALSLLLGAATTCLASAQEGESPRSAPALRHAEEGPVAVPTPSDKAMAFYRGNNAIWAFNRAWFIALTGILAFSGASARLRNLARRIGRNAFLTIGIYVVLYLAVVFVIDLPLSYYEGFVRLHAYGQSNQSLAKWFTDALLHLAVAATAGFAFAWVPFTLMARAPRTWWLLTTLLYIPFLFFTMLVIPIWIDPLYNRFGPMKDRALERQILALAERAGIEGGRVFEVEKSVDTKAMNAYVTGVFGTKRIVLWDTLIARLDEREILAVMGHEMGHYVHGDVVRSILLGSVIVLAGLFFVDRAGRWLVARFSNRLGFDRLSDVASVPLVLMLINIASLFLGPVVLAYSRYQEHQADVYSLEVTHDPHAAASAFVKMQEENLSNPRPGPIYRLLRASHPSIGERIDYFNAHLPWPTARARSSNDDTPKNSGLNQPR